MKRVVIEDLDGFMNHVFGADCFVKNFPELQTTGVFVHQFPFEHKKFYYIVDPKTCAPINHTAFFSVGEMQYLRVVEEQNE
jgi:hypothetical protein